MNDPHDRDNLLDDILTEDGAGDLRTVLLNQTLSAVKRRRVMRRVRAAGSVLSVLLLTAVGLLVWHPHTPSRREAHTREKPYVLVRTATLPEITYLQTTPLGSANLVSSSASPNVVSVETSSNAPIYQDIDDATLLALAAPRPAVLVRLGPHSAQLIFVPETLHEN